MESTLLEDMVTAGFQSVKVNGMLIYKQREFYCKAKEGVSKEAVIEAFQKSGMGHAIGMQWQTMKALSREWAELGEEPPAAIAAVVDMGENYRLRSRKA